MKKSSKSKKKGGPSFNPDELEGKAKMLKDSFPTATKNVVNILEEKSFPIIHDAMMRKWHQFVYASKMRDLYIHKLKEDLDLLDEQKVILHQLELQRIDELLANFQTESQRRLNEYERRREAIIAERNCFLSNVVKTSRSEQDWIQSTVYLMTEDNAEYNEYFFQDARLAQYSKRQEYIAEMNSYGELTLQSMRDACTRIQKLYEDYVVNTREKKTLYDKLREQNQQDELTIDRLNKKIANLKVQQMKALDRISKTKTLVSNILDLEAEKSTYEEAQNVLRARFVSESEEDQKKLDELSQISNRAIQELETDLKVAEDILSYAVLCSKYETAQEKSVADSSQIVTVETPLDKKFVKFKHLQQLLYRIALAEVQCEYMGTVILKYEKENAALGKAVRQVVGGFGSSPS